MLVHSEFGAPVWIWARYCATVEEVKAGANMKAHLPDQHVVRISFSQVLWSNKTWMARTGDVFAEVGRLRVRKAGAVEGML